MREGVYHPASEEGYERTILHLLAPKGLLKEKNREAPKMDKMIGADGISLLDGRKKGIRSQHLL